MAIGQHLPDRWGGLTGLLGGDGRGQQGLFIRGQPLGIGDAIVQPKQNHQAHEDGWQPLQQEEPLPGSPAEMAIEIIENPPGQGSAYEARQGDGDHEKGVDAPPSLGREPIGQVEDDAGKETSLGNAQQEAQEVEHLRRRHPHHGQGDEAPGHHDACDPASRPDLVQDDVAGHLEEKIADEEDARAQAINRLAEPQIRAHLQLGEADIDAIQIGQYVAEAQQGQQPPGDLTVGRVGVGSRGRVWVGVQEKVIIQAKSLGYPKQRG